MDDDGRPAWIIFFIILVFLAFIFAMAETALASVSESKLKTKADKNDVRAKRALRILDSFDVAITTILVCTNIVHIAAAGLVTLKVTELFGLSFVSISTILTTLVIFFFGEMLPKSIARKYPMKFTLALGGVILVLMTVLRPITFVLTAIGNAAARLTKSEDEVSVTEDEIYDIIEDMTEEGSLDEKQGELISSALQFRDISVGDVITGRGKLVAIDVNTPPDEILKVIRNETHSRLPVYKNSVDNIIGILQIRKYIKAYLAGGDIKNIRPLLDRPYFVGADMKIDGVLSAMSSHRKNIAVVTGKGRRTLGIITIEDILEELVGEIRDEDEPVPQKVEGGDEV